VRGMPSLAVTRSLKVLPESVAGDPERMARFEREAQVLGSLNCRHDPWIRREQRCSGADGNVRILGFGLAIYPGHGGLDFGLERAYALAN
jgi:hypothetical protein